MSRGVLQGERGRRVALSGSPLFSSKNSAIITASGGSWTVDYEAVSQAGKYLPLDWLEITNQSTQELALYLDAGVTRSLSIPGGVIKTIVDRPFNRFRVVNEGSSNIAASAVEVVAQRRARNSDDLARRELSSPLSGAGGLVGLGKALLGL